MQMMVSTIVKKTQQMRCQMLVIDLHMVDADYLRSKLSSRSASQSLSDLQKAPECSDDGGTWEFSVPAQRRLSSSEREPSLDLPQPSEEPALPGDGKSAESPSPSSDDKKGEHVCI